jgi:hypothetical protein
MPDFKFSHKEYLNSLWEKISTNKHLKELCLTFERLSLRLKYLDLETPNLKDEEKVKEWVFDFLLKQTTHCEYMEEKDNILISRNYK